MVSRRFVEIEPPDFPDSLPRPIGDFVRSPEADKNFPTMMLVNPVDAMTVSLMPIGDTPYNVFVVDNFFEDPDQVRGEALALSYRAPDFPYPGVIADPDWDYEPVLEVVRKLLKKPLPRHQFTFRFSKVTTPPEQLDERQRAPHADPSSLAGLVYLSPPEQVAGGTAFYRHRKTGVCILPSKPKPDYLETMRKHGFTDWKSWVQFLMTPSTTTRGYISGSNDDWELLDVVSMRYNRLVFYNGKMFHSGFIKSGDFGSNDEDRRLTFNFFGETAG